MCTQGRVHLYLGCMRFVSRVEDVCTMGRVHLYLEKRTFVPRVKNICTKGMYNLYLQQRICVPRPQARVEDSNIQGRGHLYLGQRTFVPLVEANCTQGIRHVYLRYDHCDQRFVQNPVPRVENIFTQARGQLYLGYRKVVPRVKLNMKNVTTIATSGLFGIFWRFVVNLICGLYFAVFSGSRKCRAIVCLWYFCRNISIF